MHVLRIPALVLIVGLFAAPIAAATTLGFVVDNEDPTLTDLFDLMRIEMAEVLDTDYTVAFPPELTIVVDDSPAAARNALGRLLADARVDMVVAVGVVSSNEACDLRNLGKPLIATLIIDREIQGIPVTETGTSGVTNLHYIVVQNLVDEDLAALYAVVPFSHVALLGTEALFETIGSLNSGKTTDLPELGATGTWVAAAPTAEALLAAIPASADAVYLLPVPNLSPTEYKALLDGLIARKLPCVAAQGESAVQAGALVGLTPKFWNQRLARRTALNARRILSGTPAGDVPVAFNREARFFLNRGTSRAIGVRPTFEVLAEAVLINVQTTDTGRLLDLHSVIEEAMARNLELAAEQHAVAAGREEVNIARSTLMPQVGIGAVGTIIDDDRAAALLAPPERTLTGAIDFSMILWSDAARANHSIQKNLQEARELALVQTRLDVALDAAVAYFNVSRAMALERIRKENLRRSRSNLENAQVRRTMGQASPAEVYRWESKIALEKSDVIEANALRNQAEIELNRILDQPLEQPFEVSSEAIGNDLSIIMSPQVKERTRSPEDLDDLREFMVAEGLKNSPELKQIDAAILAQDRSLTAAERSFWSPTVRLSGQVANLLAEDGEGSDLDIPGSPDDTNWDVSVGISLPLFQGGLRFAEKRQANEDLWRLRTERARVANLIAQRVRSVTYRAGASTAAVFLTDLSADAASRNFDLVAENYARGAVSIVDLIDAQVAYFNAEVVANDAVYANLLDMVELERSIGSFTFFATPEEQAEWIRELEDFFDNAR